MTADVSDCPVTSPAVVGGEPATPTQSRRSAWRVSLGGFLLFAAGAMVGFAPMRAWVFFRDEPRSVTISAVVLEADAKDVAGIREALKAHAEDEQSRNLDPLTVLESRPGTKILAQPTLQTQIGQQATFMSGGEMLLRDGGGELKSRIYGWKAMLEPSLRPSGNIELKYSISFIHKPTTALVDGPIPTRKEIQLVALAEESVASSVVLRADVWEAIEWKGDAASAGDLNRIRWIFLKVHPEE